MVKTILTLFLVSVILILQSCSSSMKTTITSTQSPLTTKDHVALLDERHEVPDNARKIGSLKFRDTGFSVDCSYKSNVTRAIAQARKSGANVIKITSRKSMDLLSSCNKLDAELYFYPDDATEIRQFNL